MKIGLYAMSSGRGNEVPADRSSHVRRSAGRGRTGPGDASSSPGLAVLAAMCDPSDELVYHVVAAGDQATLDDTLDLVVIAADTPKAADAFHLADRFRAIGKQVVVESPRTVCPAEETSSRDDAAESDSCLRVMLGIAG